MPSTPVMRSTTSSLDLNTLPLDVLYEILCYLLPQDLIHLTRTSKEFRYFLLNKGRRFVWKHAEENAHPLPPCPPDMSEPSYARLMFDTRCHNCTVPGATVLSFTLRVRYCSLCARFCLLSQSHFNTISNVDSILMRTILFCYMNPWGPVCTKAGAARMRTRLLSMDFGDNSTITDFIRDQENANAAISKHAQLCSEWSRNGQRNKFAEIDNVCQTRKATILSLLGEMGYDKVMEQMPRNHTQYTDNHCLVDDHCLIVRPRTLTTTEWESIRPDMIVWAEEMKELVAAAERRDLLASRKEIATAALAKCLRSQRSASTHTTDPVHGYAAGVVTPGPADFWQWAPVERFLSSPKTSDEALPHLIAAINDFPTIFLQWQQQVASVLRAKAIWGPANPPLPLALNVFRCTTKGQCRTHNYSETPEFRDIALLWYPEVLLHRCNTLDIQLPSDWEPRYAIECIQGRETSRADKASYAVGNIIKLCGLDPLRTTASDLDKLTARFLCTACTGGIRLEELNGAFRVMSWRLSVYHCVRFHQSKYWARLVRIDDMRAANSIRTEKTMEMMTPTTPALEVWKCLRCKNTRDEVDLMNTDQLWMHMSRQVSIRIAVHDSNPDK
ncbi:hypothetical protein PLICRDRAFT_176932 [Plicaturopsis crispa FD-325 SS-3]|nr:hypothetical protein PLICRDRAFT_176932 [Plicaturopsis crispa FD-325 SS-3]